MIPQRFSRPAGRRLLESRGGMWTAREIAQQPAVWLQVARLLAAERARAGAFLTPLLADPALRIVLTGAGTSAFIGECLAPALCGAAAVAASMRSRPRTS